MEYVDLVQERMANYQVERDMMALNSELRRLGITRGRSPLARLDAAILRISKGAAARQERRQYSTDHRELVS